MKGAVVVGGFTVAFVIVSIGSAAVNAFPGRNGRIVFTSVRLNGGLELWGVKRDGTGLARLTSHSPAMNQAVRPAWSPDGHSIAFDAGVLHVVDVQSGRVRSRRSIFTQAGGQSCTACPGGLAWSPDGRHFVFSRGGRLWIGRRDGSHQRRLTRGPGDRLPSWSPDGTRIAFTRQGHGSVPDPRDEPRIEIVGADGRGLHIVGPGNNASWSPEGRRLVVEGIDFPSTLAVVSADGRTRRVLLADPECSFRAPTWASRGTIAFGADCVGELQAIEPDGSGRRTLIKAAYAAAYSELMPSWSPNGRRLAFAGQNGMLRLANADGSHVRDVFRAPPGSDELPAWSPDGRRVAAVFSSTPPTHTTPELVASPVWEPAWSPDGHHLVGTLGEDYAFALVVVDLESGDERSITEHQGAALPAASAWSPDGRWIAFAWLYPAEGDQRASILFYDVARSVIVGQEGAIVGDHPSWSPDGSRLAVDTYFDDRHPERSSVFTVRRDGRQRRRLARNASQPAWSPDGRKIVFVRILGRSNSELFVMNADGSHQRRLTFNPGRDDAPDWQALPP